MALDHHVLALQLSKHVFRGLAADFNPLSAEEGAGAQDEADVEHSVEGVTNHGRQLFRGGNQVGQASHRD